MDLKDIISITGKPGLYRIVAQTGRGVIVESLDEKKAKMPVQNNYQVALLEEITIYTESDQELTLKQVFRNIFEKDGVAPSVTSKDDPAKIKNYFKEIAPGHDPVRVYISDMKKALKWYEIMAQFAPERLEAEEEEPAKNENE